MTADDFRFVTDGVFAAHGKTTPSDRILAKWYEHCADVPMLAAVEIARSLERCAKLEQNFGAQFMSCWQSWRVANPEKCAREERRVYGCRECHGGLLWWSRYDAGGYCITGASLCRCSSQSGTTASELEDRGCGVGSPLEVQAFALESNRDKTGFYDRYQRCEKYDVQKLVGAFRRDVKTAEEAHMGACHG